MPRYIRNTVILLKIEATAGVDAVPTGSANAMAISEMSITPLDATNLPRDLVRGYFGNSEQLVGVASVRCAFKVELAGSGTAGTAPAWGKALQAAAMAEAVLATPDRVEYTPVSTALKTATVYYYDDGLLHKLLGSMADVRMTLMAEERPMLEFTVTGVLDSVAAAANPTGDFTAWKKPLPVVKANTAVDVTLGCTYAAGALSGGTEYPSRGFEINFANQVEFVPNLSAESVDITDRRMQGRVTLDLTAAQEATFFGNVRDNLTQSFGFKLGSAAGAALIIYSPAVQLINPQKVDFKGRRYVGYDMLVMPSAGNDELRIVNA